MGQMVYLFIYVFVIPSVVVSVNLDRLGQLLDDHAFFSL